jgi:LysM repeat protein
VGSTLGRRPSLLPSATPMFNKTYSVKRHDNLTRIARQHGTTVNALYKANRGLIGANKNLIKPGWKLTIPPHGGRVGSTLGRRPSLLPSATPMFNKTYSVKRHDNLTRIARQHGTTVSALYKANRGVIGANKNLIKPGWKLTIPGH